MSAPAVKAISKLQQRAGALLVSTDSFFTSQRDRLVALAARHALPTIYSWREFVEAGGLMSYGPIINEVYRQASLGGLQLRRGIAHQLIQKLPT